MVLEVFSKLGDFWDSFLPQFLRTKSIYKLFCSVNVEIKSLLVYVKLSL